MNSLRNNFRFKNVILKSFVNLSNDEIALVRDWRNNNAVRKWMYSKAIISKKEHLGFIRNLTNEKRNFYWLVICEGEACGVIYLNRVDIINKNAFLGIYKDPISKEGGLGNILMDSLKYIAFRKSGLYTLKLEVFAGNKMARGFYRKSGFLEEGRLRSFVFINKRREDVIIMGLLDDASQKY